MREYALTTHHLFTEGEDGWISVSYDMFEAERVEDSEYREVEGETRLVPVRNRFESLEEAEEARDELNLKEAGPAGVIVSSEVGPEETGWESELREEPPVLGVYVLWGPDKGYRDLFRIKKLRSDYESSKFKFYGPLPEQ
jgi:hypothetical protein